MRWPINYYEVALVGNNLEPLTYSYKLEIELFSEVQVLLRGKLKKAFILKIVSKPLFKTISILTVHKRKLSQEQINIATFIASYYICSLAEALALYIPHQIEEAKVKDLVLKPLCITLSNEQKRAFQFIKKNPISLLFGDTGSGKTEIYICYFYEILKKGGLALFLMPEISLTPQMKNRIQKHFGDLVAVWHSKLSKKSKEIILKDLHLGKIKIIAGTRSVLFLPLNNLQLIVVDEEHDDSYKSGQKPRYNARDIALVIANKQKIPLLLGSATPSLASFVKIPYVRLKGGFYNSRKEIIFEAKKEAITPFILKQLDQNFLKKKRSIIFLPTRANFKYLICNSCGSTIECPYCSVGMSLHTKQEIMKCHYCNFTQSIPNNCCRCQNQLYSFRLGTAEVVQELKKRFPLQNIMQFDRDCIKTDNELKKVLKKFDKGEIDVLVGTQMLSKGHDYHDITLGIILGIDHILSQSDFKSREKALSLLIQIIGRSGRKDAAKVIVQSSNKNFFANYIHKYETFLKDEISFREGYYPPFTKLARILFAHTKDLTAKKAMNEMCHALQNYDQIEIVGASKAKIEKIANKYRYNILIRSIASKPLLKAIKATLHPLAQVDIDPIDFM